MYFYDGNLLKSLHFHLFGPLVVFIALFLIILFAMELKTKKTYLEKWLFHKKIAYYLALFLIVYHVFRLYFFITNHTWQEILQESIWY